MRYAKIDLNLLKKLVSEVESELAATEALATADANSPDVPVDFVVLLSKLSGLMASTAQEATMLVADVQKLIRINSSPVPQMPKGLTSLEAILSGLKNEDPNEPSGFGGGGNFN